MESSATARSSVLDSRSQNPLKDAYDAECDALERVRHSYGDEVYSEAAIEQLGQMGRRRFQLARQYAWGIPNEKAIEHIVRAGPIVEIGAGMGYWAKLISEAGGDIVAYDKYSSANGDNYFCDTGEYYPVAEGGPEKLTDYPERSLLLCWPPFTNSLASECLRQFKGQRVLYVGEGSSGCTGDKAFFTLLEKRFIESARISIPQWPSMHDKLVEYTRI